MELPEQALSKYFAHQSSRYERLYRAFERADVVERLRCLPWYSMVKAFRRTVPYVERLKPSRVLDIGCGIGVYAAHLGQRGILVTALDLCEQMVETARRRVEQSGTEQHVRVVQADFLDWSRGQIDRYDLALAIGILDYVKEPEQFLAAVRRLAGEAILTFPIDNLVVRIAQRRYLRKGISGWRYSRPQIAELINKAGFSIVSSHLILPGTFWAHASVAGAPS